MVVLLRKKTSVVLHLHIEGFSDEMAWCHTVSVKIFLPTKQINETSMPKC